MKKLTVILLVVAVVLAQVGTVAIGADDTGGRLFDNTLPEDLPKGEYAINANGQWIGFDYENGPKPYAEGTTAMLPLAVVGEALGCDVTQNDGKVTIVYQSVTVAAEDGVDEVVDKDGILYAPTSFWVNAFSSIGAKTTGSGRNLYICLRTDETYIMTYDGRQFPFAAVEHVYEGKKLPYRETRINQQLDGESALVIYLHGSSARGNENILHIRRQGFGDLSNYLFENGMKTIVLAPQCDSSSFWQGGQTQVTLKDLIYSYINDPANNIDPSKVYMTGVSAGGAGTWAAVSNNPGLFAAAMPVAFSGNISKHSPEAVTDYENLAKTPLLAVAGENDTMDLECTSPDAMRETVEGVIAAGGAVRIDIMPGLGHGPVCEAAFTEDHLDWLFGHVAVPANVEADASVIKDKGNTNTLTITVTETYLSGITKQITVTFTIANNAAGTYTVGSYEVYVNTKGNTQIRECYIIESEKINADTSGANKPELPANMIPVKWNGSYWVKADGNNAAGPYQWYDYNSKMWANAVTVSETGTKTRDEYLNAPAGAVVNMDDILTMMVWIPRYKYMLFNADYTATKTLAQEIEIVFESKDAPISYGGNEPVADRIYTSGTNGECLTHPAFRFDGEELSGFWVGKFEPTGTMQVAPTDENSSTNGLTIKPNLPSLRELTVQVKNMFFTSRSMERAGNEYGYASSEVDTHMMKNMEWGAVAYLTNSKYGRCVGGECYEVTINNSSTFITGNAGDSVSEAVYEGEGCQNAYDSAKGQLASTTGNIYGIYDMRGGAFEYLMATMYGKDGKTILVSESGFTQGELSSKVMSKYIEVYEYSADSDNSRGNLGDATKETLAWFDDHAVLVYEHPIDPNNPNNLYLRSWIRRGGMNNNHTIAGMFDFGRDPGGTNRPQNFTWRLVLVK